MINFLAIVDPNVSIGDACLIALVCILIVFAMLALIWGIVALFKFIPAGKKKAKEQPKAAPAPQPVARPVLKMADIKDEDMMVAALIATIDYHNEIKEDVRVVSIKEL